MVWGVNVALVSIIMPAYNAANNIERAIASVLSQTYQEWELLIVDDCSKDQTAQIVKSISDSRVKFFKNDANLGAGLTRNKAIEEANGKYIAFLDSDDYWHKSKLEKQISYMEENNFSFTFHAYQHFNDNEVGKIITSPNKVDYKKLLKSNYIGCLTAIYNCEVLGKRYMPAIRKRQDYALWLSILKDGHAAYYLDEVLAFYSTNTGMTQNKYKVLSYQWKLYRDVLDMNLLYSTFYFINYAINGLKKHIG